MHDKAPQLLWCLDLYDDVARDDALVPLIARADPVTVGVLTLSKCTSVS